MAKPKRKRGVGIRRLDIDYRAWSGACIKCGGTARHKVMYRGREAGLCDDCKERLDRAIDKVLYADPTPTL